MRKKDATLEDYGISWAKYRELKYFCMQYREKKEKLVDGYEIRAIAYDGMPKGTGIGNPTERKALDNMKLRADVELIEQAAIEADADIYQWLLKNVTEGIPYEYLGAVPKSRSRFYDSRRKFFHILAQNR